MLPIKTAKEWGWSPSAILREAKNPHKAHRIDYALAMAYEMVESEKCPQCGVPAFLAYSDNYAITFEMDEVTCYSCAHKGEHSKDKQLDEGTTLVVRAVAEEGFELPDRQEFISREMQKAQRKADDLAAKKNK